MEFTRGLSNSLNTFGIDELPGSVLGQSGFLPSVSFGEPRVWVLWTLLAIWVIIIPLVWWAGLNSLAGLGRFRQWSVLILRTVVFTLLMLALAQLQWQLKTDRLTVIFVLDHSESIPEEKADFMLDYAQRAVNENRDATRSDMAGLIIFGGDARVEIAPYDGDLPLVGRSESTFDLRTDATNLESALKLAKAIFPEATARRIVIISDGNQNLGDAQSMAQSMAEDGIGIDVLPVDLLATSEIAVEKVVLPTEIRVGQEFEGRVVLNYDVADDNPTQTATGSLLIKQRTRDGEVVIAGSDPEETRVTLRPGKNVFKFKHKVEQTTTFEFDAEFKPDGQSKVKDLIKQNNMASAFTHVRGQGRVLMIEDGNDVGKYDFFRQQLEKNRIEVDIMKTTDLFQSPAELLQYDCVVLADVPRASGDSIEQTAGFSDAQIKMLVSNLEEMGCGIVMLGGPQSFGAGGWSNTELEKAMPVDFQIKNDKVNAVGALVLIMHASEMADGNYWQSVIAKEAIKVLGPMDYCGVVEWSDFGGTPRWLWGGQNGILRVYQNRKKMMGLVSKMVPGDMPHYDEPMQLALAGLTRKSTTFNPAMKHVIIISDGDASRVKASTLQGFVNAGIKISTVCVSSHGATLDEQEMQRIANQTGGKYYKVTNNRALPRIFQREARKVAKPLIYENPAGVGMIVNDFSSSHQILQGIDPSELPPVRGYVMTTVKENSLVEQLVIADQPGGQEGSEEINQENTTILASWRYGLGVATVFTSGTSQWADGWRNSEFYEKFATQIVRHSMRPVRQQANFTINTEVRGNEVEVVVTALDENEEFLNNLNMFGRGQGPDMNGFDIQFEQVQSGRYVGRFKTDRSGNYLFSVFPDTDFERLVAGVVVPYSSEFTDREANRPLLENLASLDPKDGTQGQVIEGDLTPASLDRLLSINPFRGGLSQTIGIQDIWPFLIVLTGVLFFADIFLRRVAVGFDWVPDAARFVQTKLRGKDRGDQVALSMARLQSRKAEMSEELEQRKSANRFEPDEDELNVGQEELDQVLKSEDRSFREKPRATQDAAMQGKEEEKLHTSRLLEAKRKSQKQRGESPKRDEN